MIPSHLKAVRELEQLLHEIAPDGKTDREALELLARPTLVLFAKHLGKAEMTKLLDELLNAPTPKPPEPALPWCYRADLCASSAIAERWDEKEGVWRPVCKHHARDALPVELRAFPNGTRKAPQRVA
jgi:hypothetical protein